jgi:hypothetical protein
MSTYTVTQDGARFEVRLDDANGQVIATFSNKLAAETFAEKQRALAQGAAEARPRTCQPDGNKAFVPPGAFPTRDPTCRRLSCVTTTRPGTLLQAPSM